MSHITTAELAAQMDALGIDREEVVAACRAGEEKVIRAGMMWVRDRWPRTEQYAAVAGLLPDGGMMTWGSVAARTAGGWRVWSLINPYAGGGLIYDGERRLWRWVMTTDGPDLEWVAWPAQVPVPRRPEETDGGLFEGDWM